MAHSDNDLTIEEMLIKLSKNACFELSNSKRSGFLAIAGEMDWEIRARHDFYPDIDIYQYNSSLRGLLTAVLDEFASKITEMRE